MSAAQQHRAAIHGVIALVALAAMYGLTAIVARFFSEKIGLFEQWYLRCVIGAIVMYLLFWRHIRLGRIVRASKRELGLMVVRSLLGFGVGACLYALASQLAPIGSVAALQIIPFSAFFGVILLRESVGRVKWVALALSVVGAVLLSLQSLGHLRLGVGEILSVTSAALFSLALVLRKKQTGELNDYELTFGMIIIGALFQYVMAVVFHHTLAPTIAWNDGGLWALLIGAGILSAATGIFSNYGFARVKATTGSIILNLELVFGVILGFVFYRELLTPVQLSGAALILCAAIMAARPTVHKKSLQ